MNERNWQSVCIKDVCDSIVDCVNKTAPIVDWETPYKMIRTTNVKSGWVNLAGVRYVSEETYVKWTRRDVPKKGDVILTREAPLGEVGMIRSEDTIFLGQRLVQYRANRTKLDNRFLLYAFQSDDLQGQIKSFGSGSTVEHMRVPDCEKLMLQLPPLPVQTKIADILSAYDDLIENNTRRIKILEEMAQLLYREWFVNFRFPGHENVKFVESAIGLIPEGWEVSKLSDICSIVMGQSPKSEFYNEISEGLPFHQGVSNFGSRFPTDKTYSTVSNRVANAQDILFSVRAPVGRINIATHKIALGRGLCAIQSNENCQSFIFQQLKENFQEEDCMGSGTIYKAVTKDDMHSILMICPPSNLTDSFELFLKPMFRNLEVLVAKNRNLRQTRDRLLPKLISGEIDVEALDLGSLEMGESKVA